MILPFKTLIAPFDVAGDLDAVEELFTPNQVAEAKSRHSQNPESELVDFLPTIRLHPLYSILLALLLSFTSTQAVPPAFSDSNCVRALYGEACGEPFIGKLATACAIRNRGSLVGVYGLQSSLLSHIDRRAWAECLKAWKVSAIADTTHGATHWESTDFNLPVWSRSMKFCGQFGKQVFFK